MQGAIRYAESIFMEFLRGRPEPFPVLRRAGVFYRRDRREFEFRALFDDGSDQRWRMPDLAVYRDEPEWRYVRRELEDVIRNSYRRACLEMAGPPRMLAPPTDEALRDELMNPPLLELRGMTFRDDRRPRRGRRPQPDMNVINEMMRWRDMELDASFYGGLAGGGMTSSNIEPPGTATTMSLEAVQRAMEQMREASAIPPRYMYEQAFPVDRCPCPACSGSRDRQDARAQSSTKSLTLLRQWLSPAQLAQYDKSRYFDVISNSGKRYQIRHGTQGNVLELDESGTTVVAALCFQPQGEAGGFPGDTMLAQKIMLENDEAAALRAANVNRGFPLPVPVERFATFTLSF